MWFGFGRIGLKVPVRHPGTLGLWIWSGLEVWCQAGMVTETLRIEVTGTDGVGADRAGRRGGVGPGSAESGLSLAGPPASQTEALASGAEGFSRRT